MTFLLIYKSSAQNKTTTKTAISALFDVLRFLRSQIAICFSFASLKNNDKSHDEALL